VSSSPPPPPPPSAPPRPAGPGAPLGEGPRPTGKEERIETLDVLRGFALLGILLVNVHLFRDGAVYDVLLGRVTFSTGPDRVVDLLVGWLASGKFLSSFAILFGVGAAMIAGRVAARGRSPRPVLARRYGWLLALGLAHMVLLFPGDILFHYGLAGLALLVFVRSRTRTLWWWSLGLLLASTLGAVVVAGVSADPADAGGDPFAAAFEELIEQRRAVAEAAYTAGGPLDRVRVRAFEAFFVQVGQLVLLPWTLALFLFGFALWRSRILLEPDRRRRTLRRAAAVGLPTGLVLNLPLGWTDPLGGVAVGASAELAVLATVAQVTGAPVLAVGYLAAVALACERPRVAARLAPLRDAGRMALTGYLLQSVLAAVAFGGFRLYGQLSSTASLAVVVAIWVVVLAVSALTMRRFERGPVEHLWRLGTYGRAGRRPSRPAPVS
jgi:uncharacterized protein